MESHRKRPSLLLRAPRVTGFLNSLQTASLLKGPGQAWTRSKQGKSQIRGLSDLRIPSRIHGAPGACELSFTPALSARLWAAPWRTQPLVPCGRLSSSLTSCVDKATEVWKSGKSNQVPQSVSSTYYQGRLSCQHVSMSSEPRNHSLKMKIHRG